MAHVWFLMLVVTRVIFVVFLAKTTPCCKRPAGKPNYPRFGFEALNLLRTLLRKGGRSLVVRGERGGWATWLVVGRLYWILYFFLQRAQWPERKESGTANVHCNQMSYPTRKQGIFHLCKIFFDGIPGKRFQKLTPSPNPICQSQERHFLLGHK